MIQLFIYNPQCLILVDSMQETLRFQKSYLPSWMSYRQSGGKSSNGKEESFASTLINHSLTQLQPCLLKALVIYSVGEHNSNKAIHSELLNLGEYNMHVAKLVNAERNRTATRVCNPLLQILVTPGAELVSLSSIISWSH